MSHWSSRGWRCGWSGRYLATSRGSHGNHEQARNSSVCAPIAAPHVPGRGHRSRSGTTHHHAVSRFQLLRVGCRRREPSASLATAQWRLLRCTTASTAALDEARRSRPPGAGCSTRGEIREEGMRRRGRALRLLHLAKHELCTSVLWLVLPTSPPPSLRLSS